MKRREFLGSAAMGMLGAAAGFVVPRLATASAGAAMSSQQARLFANVPSGAIAYLEQGEGPTALFLHGFPLNGYQWRDALARLSSHRRCIAPDFMGLGYTRVADGQSLAPRAQAEMLVQLMDHLRIDCADVVANDSGGAVAQLLSVRHPERVRSLLLTNCDSEIECPPVGLAPVLEAARRGEFAEKFVVPPLKDKNVARETLGAAAFTYPERLADATIDAYLGPLAAHPERANAYALSLVENSLAGIGKLQRQLQMPVRILWGTGDSIFSRQGAEHLHRAYPQSQGIRWVQEAKLFFPEEFPDLIADEAARLWNTAA